MPKGGGKSQVLGRALHNSREKKKQEFRNADTIHSVKHVSDMLSKTRPIDDSSVPSLQSVVERTDLESFLDEALLSQREFTAERGKIIIVGNVADVGKPELAADTEEIYDYENIPIPKRPHWDETTTPEQLSLDERATFLEWRRSLAHLEENSKLVITPFEKNLDVWRQLWRVIERSDIIVQIVDARNPLLFRCKDLEDYVKQVDSKKKLLILINKADYLSQHMRRCWADYFKTQNIPFVFCSAKEEQERLEALNAVDSDDDKAYGYFSESASEDEEEEEKEKADSEPTEEIAEESVKDPLDIDLTSSADLLAHFRVLLGRDVDSDDRVTVGMCGYPNVGKSSMINALCGEKKVAVASMPGKTRHFQTHILGNIMLCDCPGLVFPTFMNSKAALVCNGILPVDRVHDHISPVQWLCQRTSLLQIEDNYSLRTLNTPLDASEVLQAHALVKGFMTSSGRPDEARSSRYVLKDFNSGKLLYCHPPPQLSEEERNDFFNSLLRTALTDKSNPRNHEGEEEKKIVDEIVDDKTKVKKGARKLTRKEKARIKAHARMGMNVADGKYRKTVGILGYADQ